MDKGVVCFNGVLEDLNSLFTFFEIWCCMEIRITEECHSHCIDYTYYINVYVLINVIYYYYYKRKNKQKLVLWNT